MTIRRLAFPAAFVVGIGGFLALQNSAALQSNGEVHTLLEAVATVLALFIGALALVRFYSGPNAYPFLFIGTGFFVTGVLDSCHTVASSSGFIDSFPSAASSLVPWSWFASRLFLSVFLWASWLFWARESRLGRAGRIGDAKLYSVAASVVLACTVLFTLTLLPSGYFEKFRTPRPQELLPALFFCLALTGYLRKGQWRADQFEYCLILALIASVLAEAPFMLFSRQLYDTMFVSAHVLKIVAYLFVIVGQLVGLQRLYSESAALRELEFKNIILSTQQEVSPDAVLVVNEQAEIISYNRRFVELWGLPEELVAARLDDPVLLAGAAQVETPGFVDRVRQLNTDRHEVSLDEIALKDGRSIERYSAPMTARNGKHYGRVWFFRDITDRKRSKQALQESEAQFRALAEQALVGVSIYVDGRIVYANPKFAQMFGYSTAELLGMQVLELAVENDRGVVGEAMRRRLSGGSTEVIYPFRGLRKDGTVIDLESYGSIMRIGDRCALFTMLLDVTDRVRAQQEVEALQVQLREQAVRDPLTGLYNRRHLQETLGHELARAQRTGRRLSLVMCDIDHFKAINDTHGHPAGDEVLKAVATLLKSSSRAGDIVSRVGGEEFVMLLPEMETQAARERAECWREVIEATPVQCAAGPIRITASFGVASFPENGKTADELIAAADVALYAAKKAGRNKVRHYGEQKPASARSEPVMGTA